MQIVSQGQRHEFYEHVHALGGIHLMTQDANPAKEFQLKPTDLGCVFYRLSSLILR